MANSLFSSMPTMTPESNGGLVKNFLCTLEGWKTKIKNLHWAAPKMNTHKLLDEIADFTGDFQDSLAEEYMGLKGQLPPNILKGTPCDCLNMKDLLSCMSTETMTFYNSIPEGYPGIKSETETFIHNINKYKYLSDLCDVTPY